LEISARPEEVLAAASFDHDPDFRGAPDPAESSALAPFIYTLF